LSVFFALWVIGLVVGVAEEMAAGPKAEAVGGVAALAAAIFFNVRGPELIYQGAQTAPFALLKESVDFITKNPFAWFPPNLIFAFVILWATKRAHHVSRRRARC